MSKSKKQIKQEQAQMQSDAVEMDSWVPSDGITMTGPAYTTSSIDDLDSGMSYSFGALGQLDLFSEEDITPFSDLLVTTQSFGILLTLSP